MIYQCCACNLLVFAALRPVLSSLILCSSMIAWRCSVCHPSISQTSSTYGTCRWGRCTSSPSSSSAVWFYSGSSRHPRLPLSSPWWCVNSPAGISSIATQAETVSQCLQRAGCDSTDVLPCVNSAGVGAGVHQEVNGLLLHQEGAELARRPHARKQEEEAWGRRGGEVVLINKELVS